MGLIDIARQRAYYAQHPEMRPENIQQYERELEERKLQLGLGEAEKQRQYGYETQGARLGYGQPPVNVETPQEPPMPTTTQQIEEVARRTGIKPKITVKGTKEAEGVTATFDPKTLEMGGKQYKRLEPTAQDQAQTAKTQAATQEQDLKVAGDLLKYNILKKHLTGEKLSPQEQIILDAEIGKKEPKMEQWQYEALLEDRPSALRLDPTFRGPKQKGRETTATNDVKEAIKLGATPAKIANSNWMKAYSPAERKKIVAYATRYYKWWQIVKKGIGY